MVSHVLTTGLWWFSSCPLDVPTLSPGLPNNPAGVAKGLYCNVHDIQVSHPRCPRLS